MKKAKGLYAKIEHEPVFHKTSIGRNPSKCKMNKSKRRQVLKNIVARTLTNILNYPIL